MSERGEYFIPTPEEYIGGARYKDKIPTMNALGSAAERVLFEKLSKLLGLEMPVYSAQALLDSLPVFSSDKDSFVPTRSEVLEIMNQRRREQRN